ncbi:MAG: magnesium and cobalt transport protein CorA [Microbacteriaceae bacterium]|nr:magnesium and cobalt transport protein CorA [Microbacteriaceae bacterium]
MPVIDNAVYVAGHRTENPRSLDETYEVLREREGMAWIGLYRPDEAEVSSVAAEFDLHQLSVDDALAGHQRAKLERYGDILFVVLRPAMYRNDSVEFGELHVFLGPGFVVTIRRAESPDLSLVRKRLEADPVLLAMGPEAVLYAILDQVVDEYAPVLADLQSDIDKIEDQLFEADADVSRRIYTLLREVTEFQRAAQPLESMLDALDRGAEKYSVNIELRRLMRDVQDHVFKIVERLDTFRVLLQNALTLQSTLVTQRQNEEMKSLSEAGLVQNEEMRRVSETSLAQTEQTKRISSWAAILFAPTLIGTIYGMNFDFMPELHWPLGYPMAVGLMFVMGGALYLAFKRKHWL